MTAKDYEGRSTWVGPLYSQGRARTSDPETSKLAAAAVGASSIRRALRAALSASGGQGLTAMEAACLIAPPHIDPGAYLQSVSPRFAEMRELGYARVLTDSEGKPVRRDRRQVWITT